MRILNQIFEIMDFFEEGLIEEFRHEVRRGMPAEDLSFAMTQLLVESYVSRSNN